MKPALAPASLLATLQENPLLRALPQERLEHFESTAHVHHFHKGHLLFTSGDSAKNFYIIVSGWVKLYRETLDGTQAIIDVLNAGHVFGDAALFDHDQYPYSAEIVEAGDIIAIPLSALKAELEANPNFTRHMLANMARDRRQQDKEIEHRSIMNAPQRIGCFLLRLAQQNQTDSKISIHLPYDKTLLASRLGMQPETFSRALSRLRDETGIKIKGSTIELERLSQLTDYSCSACSSGFPCKDM